MTATEAVIKNVNYLIRERKVKVGKLETSFGLRKGYFARKTKTLTDLPFEIVYGLSKYFNISLDELADEDYYKKQTIKSVKKELEVLEDSYKKELEALETKLKMLKEE